MLGFLATLCMTHGAKPFVFSEPESRPGAACHAPDWQPKLWTLRMTAPPVFNRRQACFWQLGVRTKFAPYRAREKRGVRKGM